MQELPPTDDGGGEVWGARGGSRPANLAVPGHQPRWAQAGAPVAPLVTPQMSPDR